MIFVTHALPVNAEGEPHVSRADLWRGLVAKAGNALPFVPAMTACVVTARHGDTVFDREISYRGQDFTERITLEEPHRVVFTRLRGPVLGTIANEIEGAEIEGAEIEGADGPGDEDLALRFSFALTVTGVPGGSAAEREIAGRMTADYLDAVTATLAAVRRVVRGDATLTT